MPLAIRRRRTKRSLRFEVLELRWTPAYDVVDMVQNGPSSNRVDMVFLGDGYTAGQIDTQYVADINDFLTHIFQDQQDPFPRYAKFFNVHRVNVISNETGADVPPEGIFRDTALGSRYFFDGVTERLLYVSDSKANAALSSALAGASYSAEMKLVTVNDARYGGGGGSFAVYAGGNVSSAEIALHELGHSFSGLADEYDYSNGATYAGGEPGAANVTKSSTGSKWANWIGYQDPSHPELGTVGAYEGGMYNTHGIYRPTVTSKMESLGMPFNAPSREKIIRDIYAHVKPLDSWSDNSATIEGLDPLVSVVTIDPAVISVEWSVDGVVVPNATDQTFELTEFGIAPGAHTVTARAYDPTPWVRGDRSRLEQTVSWNVTLIEDPTPPNVNVTVVVPDPGKPLNKRLEITGTAKAEQIVIDLGYGGVTNAIRVSALGSTTINNGSVPLLVTGITDSVVVTLLGGNDVVQVNGGKVKAPISLDGSTGNDTYGFASSKIKYVVSDSSGIDLFDFSRATFGASIDLAKGDGSSQSMGGGNSLKLTGVIENVFGSAFADTLKGNSANNYLVGGGGNDTITGGSGGYDLLIGGAGKDKLTSATSGNSILIGGSTAHDAVDQALRAILAEWRRSSGGAVISIDDRIGQLTGVVAGGLNGSTYLVSPGTVVDDASSDTLTGLAGKNWFFKPTTDKLKGQLSSDRVT